MLRNVHKEFINKDCDVNNPESYGGIYGCTEVLINMIKSGVDFKDVSHIYDFLIEGIISKNNSVIPSRSERRIDGVRWSTAWKNLHGLRGLNAEEYVFAWKLQQDMLLIGSRLHRPNADRSFKIV